MEQLSINTWRTGSPVVPDYDILVAGELNPDLILSGDDITPRFGQYETLVEDARLAIGGSAAIFACGATRLGLRVVFVGVVGNDEFGRFMTQALAARGVDVSPVIVDPSLRTGLSVILSRRADRAILTYSGAIAALQAEQVSDPLLTSARHLHIAGYFLQTALQPGLADLFRRAKSAGLTTSLDTNWDPDERWDSGLADAYQHIDVLLPNEQEAMHLGKAHDWRTGALTLATNRPIVVVKRGANGAALIQGESTFEVGAPRVTVLDTTGAGDSFNAGFLYGFLHGWPPMQSLRLAVACGTLSTRAVGGTEGQPTLEEAMQVVNAWPI
jgi:sugar/nucleoside kinase (ribokinase family)